MIRTRTYYCSECKKCTTFKPEDKYECKCGNVFGIGKNISDYINMRRTPSGTTKIEFSHTTHDKVLERIK